VFTWRCDQTQRDFSEKLFQARGKAGFIARAMNVSSLILSMRGNWTTETAKCSKIFESIILVTAAFHLSWSRFEVREAGRIRGLRGKE